MDWDFIFLAAGRLAITALLGGLIGLEREHHGRSAGFRTQMLVAIGATLAMLVSIEFAKVYGHHAGAIRVDPARVAYGVMTGIGFLGAGAILRYGVDIRGLTTAASLWCTAAVGLAVGFGMIPVALIATGLVLFVLYVLRFVDHFIPVRQSRKVTVHLPAAAGDANIDRVRDLLAKRHVHIASVEFSREVEAQLEKITFHVSLLPRGRAESVLLIADDLPDLKHISVV